MRKSFKFRLFTNKNQDRLLREMLETHRRLYNSALDDRIICWETAGVSLSYYFQAKRLTVLRRTNPHYRRINAQSSQATLRRLDRAFQAFFRRIKAKEKPGYPRFKSKDRFNSFTFPQHGDGVRLIGNHLRIQHIGTIRVRLHRETEGKIKTVTLKLENDRWFVIFSCDLGKVDSPQHTGPPVGIDLGLSHFLTTSQGKKVDNPRFLEKKLKYLRRANRSLNRKKLGSNTRKKAKKKVRHFYWKVSNQRRDFHHRTARQLVDSHSLIAAENLNIKGMLKNRRFSRGIADVGWSQFLFILTSKAESAGSQVVLINPRGTSQDCSNCGTKIEKDLSIRVHQCGCGLVIDRDENAALNILARAWPRDVNVGID